jgi:serine/threonine protein kinase/Tol biopolymer transport system component
MALAPGTQLGTYEISGSLGAGGMGEVYRARDSKLGRSVAIKVLPHAFAADPDRVSRFEREAKVLASLNHPHIAALYGMELSGGAGSSHFLIMELVEGETLLERLHRGPLPAAEALAIAAQIAGALESAHEQGVVHRDLKPANVKITPDDKVKVLDFGLAKAMDSSPAASSPANSPTLSVLATQAGLIMGTAAYMSPEQAKGLATDRRSDVFSFGVVLYELLTARQPFGGETAAEIMASVMLREADLTLLPAGLNPRIREVIARCLEKNPKKRWQSMGDLRHELEALSAAPYAASLPNHAAAVASPLWKRAVPIVAAVIVTAIVSTLATRWLTPPATREVYRFAVASPNLNQNFQNLAWSPDGLHLAYVTSAQQNVRQLMLRTMGDLEAHPIPGAPGFVSSPAFSPDGRFIAFFSGADFTLKKIAITGGAVVTLCKMAPPYSGPDWKGNDILFVQTNGVLRVSADGGEPELIVKTGPGERIAGPQYIDDRGTMLFSLTSEPLLSAGWDKGQVIVQDVDGTRQVIASGASGARYLPSGHIVYMSGSTLMAVPFDAASRRTSGNPVPVVQGVARGVSQRFVGHYAVSPSGALAYVSAGPPQAAAQRTLALVDMNGKSQPLPAPPNAYQHPRVSPDGTRVVVATDTGREAAIWIYELSGNSLPRRLTFDGNNHAPIWSPDGQSITFQSDRDGSGGLFRQRADGSGTAERLTTSEPTQGHFPYSWSPDGTTLAFRVASDAANSVWTWSNDDRTARLVMQGAPAAVTAEFSPDGRWLAYGSNELNPSTYQVFVQPWPLTGAKYQVNPMTASTPVWSRNGKRLFSAYNERIFSAAIQTNAAFTAGPPIEIKMPNLMGSSAQMRHFDLMPNGKQFLVVLPADAGDSATPPPPTQITVVLNWLDELKARTAPRP